MSSHSWLIPLRLTLAGAILATSVVACGDDGDEAPPPAPVVIDDRPENTGAACVMPEDCYPDVMEGAIEGQVQCLDRVRGGYCTHECVADEDCCAAEGECGTEEVQVCSPFESTGDMLCFLSCEEADLFPAPGGGDDPVDANEFCQREAGSDFICRSSGGGASNRKVCVPGDCGLGASCATTDDCPGDNECVPTLGGGTCTVATCTEGSCPADSVCVADATGATYCHPTCTSNVDCSFCRADADGTCSDTVETVGGTIVSACTY